MRILLFIQGPKKVAIHNISLSHFVPSLHILPIGGPTSQNSQHLISDSWGKKKTTKFQGLFHPQNSLYPSYPVLCYHHLAHLFIYLSLPSSCFESPWPWNWLDALFGPLMINSICSFDPFLLMSHHLKIMEKTEHSKMLSLIKFIELWSDFFLNVSE